MVGGVVGHRVGFRVTCGERLVSELKNTFKESSNALFSICFTFEQKSRAFNLIYQNNALLRSLGIGVQYLVVLQVVYFWCLIECQHTTP